ncbi:MAG: two-component system, NarL family, sensor histidine kinase DesK [Streptomyces sp.]|nr:two-component system, NarL family, sensor histidine kinase DesK [Streptomyces sp.]
MIGSGVTAKGRTTRLAEKDVPAPLLARMIILFALFCFGLISVINMLQVHPSGTQVVVFSVCLAGIYALQLIHCSAAVRRWPWQWVAGTLVLQAVLTYLPSLAYDTLWGSQWGCLGGSLLLLVPGFARWVLFTLVAASAAVVSELAHVGGLYAVYLVQSTVLSGFVIYGFTRLVDLVSEVHASRGELARMAVSQERMRFSRDLHDLLGYSLSAITLKSELLYRLIGDRSDQAREEVTSILDVSRQALSDVRLVASGYRDMSLAAEADSAASILAAAGVQAEVDVECGRLHPLVDTVLATALREGITNILRHSKVQHCSITAAAEGETVRLTLVNDGVGEGTAILSPHSGSGIGNLQLRLTAVGGWVDAGVRDDGRFHLVAKAPLSPEPQTAEPSSEDTAARPAA